MALGWQGEVPGEAACRALVLARGELLWAGTCSESPLCGIPAQRHANPAGSSSLWLFLLPLCLPAKQDSGCPQTQDPLSCLRVSA